MKFRNIIKQVRLFPSILSYPIFNRHLSISSYSCIEQMKPSFKINSKNVEILHNPLEFYNSLKHLSDAAQDRIVISSLYLGTGHMEKELVECWKNATCRNKDLKIHILLDYVRGSRGKKNSRTMLLPLFDSFNDNLCVSLYHTPHLREYFKNVLPDRWNELIGLNHMKIYLFDDNVIISGANLSDLYFLNRQDRYILIKHSKQLADYFHGLVKTVGMFSFQMNKDNTVNLDPSWKIHPFQGDLQMFKSNANEVINKFIDSQKSISSENNDVTSENDTIVSPRIQMGELNINQDVESTVTFLNSAKENDLIKLTTGYFNLHSTYMDCILSDSKALFHVLMASPEANGFYGASGLSYAIPFAYTHIAHEFFKKLKKNFNKSQERISLYEFSKDSWTFHAKGLWHYEMKSQYPSATLIGSPNFGYRSVQRDLECQVYIATKDSSLKEKLHDENQRLFTSAKEMNEHMYIQRSQEIPLWVKMVAKFAPSLF